MRNLRDRRGVSEIVAVVLLLFITLAFGSVYVVLSLGHVSNISGTISDQTNQAIVKAGQLLDLEFYIKGENYTELWIFSYGSSPIFISRITTSSSVYTLQNATLTDVKGYVVDRILPETLYRLVLPEAADVVEVYSTVGGMWRWETP